MLDDEDLGWSCPGCGAEIEAATYTECWILARRHIREHEEAAVERALTLRGLAPIRPGFTAEDRLFLKALKIRAEDEHFEALGPVYPG